MEYNLQQFERDFMVRTQGLLNEYRGEYEATFVLNCCLGLLIVPRERLLRAISTAPITDLPNWGLSLDSIVAYGRDYGSDSQTDSLKWFVIKMRNAVAHFHILPVHKTGKVSAFEFWDRSGFRAIISVSSLKRFVETISNRIVAAIDNQEEASESERDTSKKWRSGANLFTRIPPNRVYVIDCPVGYERQCYEISSSSAEFYIFGCDKELPNEGATDVVLEPIAELRRQRLTALALSLSNDLPTYKRLSIYTNDEILSEQLGGQIAHTAKKRLSFYGVFRIDAKRLRHCPTSVVA